MQNQHTKSTGGGHTTSNMQILDGLQAKLKERYHQGIGADYLEGFSDAITEAGRLLAMSVSTRKEDDNGG